MTDSTSLNIEEISAISNGSHGDPFSLLGLHELSVNNRKKLIVRTFQPNVKAVSVLPAGGKKTEMTRVSEEGLFECPFPRRKRRFSYELEIEPLNGSVYRVRDAYQFDSTLSDFDLHLWGEGNHHHAFRWMGAHSETVDNVNGTRFVVSAPAATRVSVIGSFNNWDARIHGMRRHPFQGIWEIFIPHVAPGDYYKFEIRSPFQERPLKKSDPYAFQAELRPGTASKVWQSSFDWSDKKWMDSRRNRQSQDKPMAVYEIHPGSWRRKEGEDPGFLSYSELADELIPYLVENNFTHVELMPVAEHPYDPSWGYQITGYFAVTSRFGTPDDFKLFVNRLHREGLGVFVDWVPAHFTKDEHGLRLFDGTSLYEHADPRRGEHPDWGTSIFNYGRSEVLNFLISNAVFWFEEYHIDGLRVDAVASMLYLDYSRKEGDWLPNLLGGRENLEAIRFLKRFNEVVHDYFPGILTMAEESTSWPGVSRPVREEGLGFDFKWNMGWMNDTLEYFSKDPVHRKYHHQQLTFSLIYAFSEKFILPLSHDEVVHGKRSQVAKMPGDDWQKFANLRLLFTYMYGHPGKKLLFMGDEFGQWREWSEEGSIDWHLLQWDTHRGLQAAVRDLNRIYQNEPALYEVDNDRQGFQWIESSDADNSVLSFIRRAHNTGDYLVFICNFTPTVHREYITGLPESGKYEVIFNSDSGYYHGSNAGSSQIEACEGGRHDQPFHSVLTLPPLAGIILKPVRQ